MAEPFIGEVDLFAFNFVPQNWAPCAGALIAITQNQALYALLGNMYGGDGRTNFALPDLRGKMALSMGQHPGSRFDWDAGQTAGTETLTLSEQELAQHSHTATFTPAGGGASATVDIAATTDTGDSASPSAGAYLAQAAPPGGGPDKPEQIYKTTPAASSTVGLGGVTVSGGGSSSGTVTIDTTGNNTKFSLIQSTLILNYCMAMQGLFPSRN